MPDKTMQERAKHAAIEYLTKCDGWELVDDDYYDWMVLREEDDTVQFVQYAVTTDVEQFVDEYHRFDRRGFEHVIARYFGEHEDDPPSRVSGSFLHFLFLGNDRAVMRCFRNATSAKAS